MKRFLEIVYKLDLSFQVIAGIVLTVMMVVTLLDVTMRALGRPIVGTVEIICFSGAVVIGFAIPYSSWMKAHIFVDFLVDKLSPRARRIMGFCTTGVAFLLFLFIGYNFIIYGLDLMRTKEVSASFRIPYYPITFGLALSCFLESLTLFCELVKLAGGGKHE